MNRKIRSRVSMAERVSRYVATLPSLIDGAQSLAAELDRARERLQALDEQFRGEKLETLAFSRMKRELRSAIRSGRLLLVSRTAKRVARVHRDFAERYTLPGSGAPLQAFLTGARDILAAARADEAVLLEYGLPAGTLDALAEQLARWEAVAREEGEHAQRRMLARLEQEATVRGMMDVVGQLDGLVRTHLAPGDPALRAWRRAVNIVDPALPQPDEPAAPPAAPEEDQPAA